MDPPSDLIITSTFVLEPAVTLEHLLRGTSLGTHPTFFLTTTVGYGNEEYDLWTAVAGGHYATLYHGLSRFRVALLTWIAVTQKSSYFSVVPIDGEIPPRIQDSIGILRIRRDFVATAFCTPLGRPVFPDLSPSLEAEWDRVIPRRNQLRVMAAFPAGFEYPANDFVYFVNPDEIFPTALEGADGMEFEGDGEDEMVQKAEGTVVRVRTEVTGGPNRNHIGRAVSRHIIYHLTDQTSPNLDHFFRPGSRTPLTETPAGSRHCSGIGFYVPVLIAPPSFSVFVAVSLLSIVRIVFIVLGFHDWRSIGH